MHSAREACSSFKDFGMTPLPRRPAGGPAIDRTVFQYATFLAPQRDPSWADVRFWHLADVPIALTNVCFEAKNGHDAGVTPVIYHSRELN